jgi:hypothetical protein
MTALESVTALQRRRDDGSTRPGVVGPTTGRGGASMAPTLFQIKSFRSTCDAASAYDGTRGHPGCVT